MASKHYTTLPFRRSVNGRLMLTHRLRAEAALGKPLPPKAVVHHVDGTKSPLSPLVICQDQKYHMGLHVRLRVLRAGGNPYTDKICCMCHRVQPHSAFHRVNNGQDARCKGCCKSIRNKGTASALRTYCPHGHPYSKENTLIVKTRHGVGRSCRACRRSRYTPTKRVLKTHCKRGHPFSPENTYVYSGSRYCRKCHSDGELARQRRLKLVPAGPLPRWTDPFERVR